MGSNLTDAAYPPSSCVPQLNGYGFTVFGSGSILNGHPLPVGYCAAWSDPFGRDISGIILDGFKFPTPTKICALSRSLYVIQNNAANAGAIANAQSLDNVNGVAVPWGQTWQIVDNSGLIPYAPGGLQAGPATPASFNHVGQHLVGPQQFAPLSYALRQQYIITPEISWCLACTTGAPHTINDNYSGTYQSSVSNPIPVVGGDNPADIYILDILAPPNVNDLSSDNSGFEVFIFFLAPFLQPGASCASRFPLDGTINGNLQHQVFKIQPPFSMAP